MQTTEIHTSDCNVILFFSNKINNINFFIWRSVGFRVTRGSPEEKTTLKERPRVHAVRSSVIVCRRLRVGAQTNGGRPHPTVITIYHYVRISRILSLRIGPVIWYSRRSAEYAFTRYTVVFSEVLSFLITHSARPRHSRLDDVCKYEKRQCAPFFFSKTPPIAPGRFRLSPRRRVVYRRRSGPKRPKRTATWDLATGIRLT